MASKRFKQQFSDEERRAYKQAQLDTARERITEMAQSWQQNPQEIADYFKFASSFYQYSSRNQMLIYSQRDTALFVASMKEWHRRGYSIKKGEHGLQIIVPSPIKMFQDEDGIWLRQTSATAAQMEKIRRGELPTTEQIHFTVRPVFDITQTTCPVEEYPKLLGLGYNETQHAAMYAAAKEYCAAQGSEVKEELLDVTLRGFYRHADQSITINTMLGDTQRLSTLLHEFAHHALDHRTREISSAQKEFEADALSVMLEDRCGIPITDTRRAHLAKAYSECVAEQQADGKIFSPEEAFKPINEQYRLHNEALTAHFLSRDLTPIVEPTLGELPMIDEEEKLKPSFSFSENEQKEKTERDVQFSDNDRDELDMLPVLPIDKDLSETATVTDTVSPKKTMVVNFFAGPAAGKTTCAWIVAAELKKRGYTAEYVGEYAKELVWEDRSDLLDGTPEKQKALLDEQMRREARLMGKVDFIVTDSPTLLNVAYLAEPDAAYEKQVADAFKAKDNFCIFVERGEGFETVGRVHDEAQSQAIDASVRDLLDRNKIFYGKYRHETVAQAIDNIEKSYARLNTQKEKTERDVQFPNTDRDELTQTADAAVRVTKPRNTYSSDRPSISAAIKDQLKEIPITDVAAMLGVQYQTRGNRSVCAVRDEKTASCTLYSNNTFYDFGASIGGDTIKFVQYVNNVDFYEAARWLADQAGIEITAEKKQGQTGLSDQQYALIGIDATLATRNFDLDVVRWGAERTEKFATQYQMSVQDLAVKHPDVYHNMLRARAIPYVYGMRQEYYEGLLSADELSRSVGANLRDQSVYLAEFTETARKLNVAENTMKRAIFDHSKVTFKAVTHDVVKDIEGIRSGTISFEIGQTPYAEFKKETSKREGDRCFRKIPYEDYVTDRAFANTPHAAFYRAGEVNVAYDAKYHQKLFPNVDLAEVQRPATTKTATVMPTQERTSPKQTAPKQTAQTETPPKKR